MRKPRTRRWMLGLGTILVAGSIALGIAWRWNGTPRDIPTAEVKRGEFMDRIQLRGEITARKSISIIAPFNAGDLQIIKLIRNGTYVKKGEIVVQFDALTLERTLNQKRSELKQAAAEIERTIAQGRITEEKNLTEVTKARYDVERARLEASKQEILSKIEGEKTALALANAEQKLHEVEAKLAADRVSVAADVESTKQKRDKALFEVRQSERQSAAMTLRAPAEGMLTLMQNWRAGGAFGDNAPEFKEGDRAWPGAALAELPDLSSMRVSARIEESDRGRLQVGQEAIVRADAVPDKELSAHVVEISTLAKMDFSGWPPKKNFNVALQLENLDPRLRPGMSATARAAVEKLPDSILIPSEASFQRGGKTIVYVLRGQSFEPREIEVRKRGEGKLVVSKGVVPGERVALKDPFSVDGKN
jgi:HlyD family secretion protein